MDVSISKTKLIDRLRENRAQHIKFYLEAKENYSAKVAKELKSVLKLVTSEAPFNLDFVSQLIVPRSFEQSYNDAINMLEYDNRDNIVLSQSEFTQYVLDRWNWASTFTGTSSRYTNNETQRAMRQKYGD